MITRLTLKKTNEWIDVKDQQTVRDEKDVHTYSNDGLSADGQSTKYNIVKHRIATAAVRIKNWSVENGDGKVIHWPGVGSSFKERVDVIESLYEKQLDRISEAITAHLNALAKAEDEEKKETPDGGTDSGPSSPSVN
jgi:hypothetical protein